MTFQRKIQAICKAKHAYDKEDMNSANNFLSQYEEQKEKCMELAPILEIKYRTLRKEPETQKLEEYYAGVDRREIKSEDLMEEVKKVINTNNKR